MSEIKSTCIRNCCLDEKDICLGCFRSIAEIMQWHNANDQEKRQTLTLARVRRNEHQELIAMRMNERDLS